MANAEHVERLSQGVEAWNQWRQQNPTITPDLSDARLRKRDLSDADFTGTNLERADLSRANLRGAKLVQASLNRASLIKTDLRGALLHCTRLTGAQVHGTNFKQADLTGACIQDWLINHETQLDEVICDYIYLQSDLPAFQAKFA